MSLTVLKNTNLPQVAMHGKIQQYDNSLRATPTTLKDFATPQVAMHGKIQQYDNSLRATPTT